MKTALVIDDLAAVRRSVEMALKREGFAVEAAEGFVAARALCLTQRFDLVVTDILMPDHDGMEVIDFMRRSMPDAKIVAMSGGGSLVNREEALTMAARSADATIRKPFDRSELMAVIAPLFSSTGEVKAS